MHRSLEILYILQNESYQGQFDLHVRFPITFLLVDILIRVVMAI